MKRLKRAVIKEEFVELTGNLNEAIVLNQLIFWSERVKDSDRFLKEEIQRTKKFNDGSEMDPDDIKDTLLNGWIYKTADEMLDETMLTCSKTTIERVFKSLVEKGFVDRRRNPKYKWDKTWQYRVNLQFISNQLNELGYVLEGYSLPNNNHLVPELQNEDSKRHGAVSKLQNEDSKRHGAVSKLQNEDSKRHGAVSKLQNEAAIPEITTETTTEITTETTTTTTESDVAEIIEFWDSNGFGINNIHAKQSLLLYLNDESFDEPKEMILEAMKIACGNGKTFGRFVEGILKRWINQNIRCVDDISRHRFDEYSNQAKYPGKYPGGEDVVPEWFEDRHKRDGSQTGKRNQETQETVDINALLNDMKKMIKQAKTQGKAGATYVK